MTVAVVPIIVLSIMNQAPEKVHARGKIVAQEELSPGYFRMVIDAPEVARHAAPGQFVHLLCQDQYSPFLRRPLSLLFGKEDTIGLVYKVVGEGTRILSRRKPGEEADLIGPLGTHFEDEGKQRLLLVAGGIGIVPLVFLAQTLQSASERVHWVYGASSQAELVLQEEVLETGRECDFATMDGSVGCCGTVIDALDRRYAPGVPLPEKVYACGPEAMLKALWNWMEPREIPGQFAFENRMGCGIGACLGCVLPRRTQDTQPAYARVCCDGPVFGADEILLQAL